MCKTSHGEVQLGWRKAKSSSRLNWIDIAWGRALMLSTERWFCTPFQWRQLHWLCVRLSRPGEAEGTGVLGSSPPGATCGAGALSRDSGVSWDASSITIYYMAKITKGFIGKVCTMESTMPVFDVLMQENLGRGSCTFIGAGKQELAAGA